MLARVPVSTKVLPASGRLCATAGHGGRSGHVTPFCLSAPITAGDPARRRTPPRVLRPPGPHPALPGSLAASAATRDSSEPKWRARASAVASPTSRIPSPYSSRGRVVCLLFSMRGHEVCGRLLPHALKRCQLRHRQGIDIGRRAAALAAPPAARSACRPGPRCPARGGWQSGAAPPGAGRGR